MISFLKRLLGRALRYPQLRISTRPWCCWFYRIFRIVDFPSVASINHGWAAGDSEVYPIRVIDVDATLASCDRGGIFFTRATSWDFHTISHRWSSGMESLSTMIAAKLKQGSGTHGAHRYNELFESENFSKYPWYTDFMGFLRLLRGDGVKHVWIDVLCINQGDDMEEKNRELQNMGKYYSKSLGCYTCAHGFGEGFEIWKKEAGQLEMPTWFSRVWTFQELLLPKKITFILKISAVVRTMINDIVRRSQCGIGFCECAMAMKPELWWLNIGEEKESEEEEEEIIMEDGVCPNCGGVALVRKTVEAELYFVEAEGIVSLMKLAGPQTLVNRVPMSSEADKKLLRLDLLLKERGSVHPVDPIRVVWEISWRHCSIPEDRVLSILGLLGVEGAVQLRAGKMLDEQLLELAKSLKHCDSTMLVKLCAAEYIGHPKAGMSWAPSLIGLRGEKAAAVPTPRETAKEKRERARKQATRWVNVDEGSEGSEEGLFQLANAMRGFVRKVEVQEVRDDGSLALRAAHVWENCRFVRVNEHEFHFEMPGASSQSTEHYNSLKFQAYFSYDSCLLLRRRYVAQGGIAGTTPGGHMCIEQTMLRLQGQGLGANLKDFQVSLLLLGQIPLVANDEHQSVFMVCVGNMPDSLHKIGIGWFTSGQVYDIFEESSSSSSDRSVTIGGFSDYMTRFVLGNCSNSVAET